MTYFPKLLRKTFSKYYFHMLFAGNIYVVFFMKKIKRNNFVQYFPVTLNSESAFLMKLIENRNKSKCNLTKIVSLILSLRL